MCAYRLVQFSCPMIGVISMEFYIMSVGQPDQDWTYLVCGIISFPPTLSHLHQCRQLEEEREHCAAEQVACQGQVEALQRVLQEQETLLAEKVRGC